MADQKAEFDKVNEAERIKRQAAEDQLAAKQKEFDELKAKHEQALSGKE